MYLEGQLELVPGVLYHNTTVEFIPYLACYCVVNIHWSIGLRNHLIGQQAGNLVGRGKKNFCMFYNFARKNNSSRNCSNTFPL